MIAEVFDSRICQLGEGPLWHPQREQLFWFDITNGLLLSSWNGTSQEWAFEENVSAAGWVNQNELLIASETALYRFHLVTNEKSVLCLLEADNPATRSNDGRADPWGGFWIGTMGKNAEAAAGAIYRYFKGELRKIVADITVSNAICFSPNSPRAYFTDTISQQVMSLELDTETGWPVGKETVFLDLSDENLYPDGAVTDAAGNIWIAEWGNARVSGYSQDGARTKSVAANAAQTSCPAFGGPDLTDLYITSAAVGLSPDELAHRPDNGKTFVSRAVGQGRAEYQVRL